MRNPYGPKDRVQWRESPLATGTVTAADGDWAEVRWDGYKRTKWYKVSDLRTIHGRRRANPQAVQCDPQIQALEIATRIDPETEEVRIVRDPSFRAETPKPVIEDSRDIYEAWKGMGLNDQEHIVVGLLSVRGHLIGWRPVHKGRADSVEASVRDIIKDAIKLNASSIIVAHNHPSGYPDPSEADHELTEAIWRLAGDLEIELIDHIIVGRPGDDREPYYSFRDAGLIPEAPTGERPN